MSNGATSTCATCPQASNPIPDMRLPLTLTLALTLVSIPLHAAPLIVAHRGASFHAPENTVPAFELAWKKQADAIEGDFRLTKDGHIVCLHDADTKKVAGKKLVVASSTLAELRALDVGAWKAPRWTGTRIPTLPEVLATVPDGKQIFVEIKCGPEIIPPLVRQLRASGLQPGQVVIIAFDSKVIRAIKTADPAYQANWLCSFKKKDDHTMPEPSKVLTTLTACGADGLGSNAWPDIDAAFIGQIRATGCSYHVWTINDAPTARRFRDLGADSITTDRPADIRKILTVR